MSRACLGPFGSFGIVPLALLVSACGNKVHDTSAARPTAADKSTTLAARWDPAYPEIDLPPVWDSGGKPGRLTARSTETSEVSIWQASQWC